MDGGTECIEGVWRIVEDLYCKATCGLEAAKLREIEDELLFCLLGGFGITYEHGRSASAAIRRLRPFSSEWEEQKLHETIFSALMRPQFEPRKTDGSFRRYRFPKQKAGVITKARRWLHSQGSLDERLHELGKPQDRRTLLIGCPGIGFKSASWLLRNIGLGDELAVIDIHVFRALLDAKRIPDHLRMPKDYEKAEEAFLAWCNELHAPSAAFDLFLWQWQRGSFLRT